MRLAGEGLYSPTAEKGPSRKPGECGGIVKRTGVLWGSGFYHSGVYTLCVEGICEYCTYADPFVSAHPTVPGQKLGN